MSGAKHGRRWWFWATGALAAGAVGWAAWQLWQPDPDMAAPVRDQRLAAASASFRAASPEASPAASDGSRVRVPPPAGSRTDAVGPAPDLRLLYDQYASSVDPQQRRTAARAFGACVPAFLPSAGEAPSAEPLIQALPAAQRSEREAAYRALYARCSRFMDESRSDLGTTLRSLQRDGDVREPGERAAQALLAGRTDDADRAIGQATSGDPAAVESLSGLAARLARERTTDPPDASLLETARAVDAALPAVACDLGLDCSANSLWSLQLCATEGRCQGDLLARLAARDEGDPVDPALVQQQRQRLLALLRSGRRLTSADLLP